MRIPLLLVSIAALSAGFLSSLGAEDSLSPEGPVEELKVYPMGLMDSVRRIQGKVPMQVQIYNPGSSVHSLDRLRILGPPQFAGRNHLHSLGHLASVLETRNFDIVFAQAGHVRTPYVQALKVRLTSSRSFSIWSLMSSVIAKAWLNCSQKSA